MSCLAEASGSTKLHTKIEGMAAEQRLVAVEREKAADRARGTDGGDPPGGHQDGQQQRSEFHGVGGWAEVWQEDTGGSGVSKSHRLASGAHRLCGATAGGAVGTKGVCRLCLCMW